MEQDPRHEAGGPVDEHGLPLAWRGTFLTAHVALCNDDVETARPLFERIEAAFPKNAEVRLHAAWARARLADVLREADYIELERLARLQLGEHGPSALALCVLAHVAARRGELRVARRLFAKAADAEPSLVDARRGARRLQRRLGPVSTKRTSR